MKSILDFLTDLRANNNREWFAANKSRYIAANEIFNDFAADLLASVQAFDPATRELTLKDCTYRIYRDTRFSHDKTPYKTHFGLYICPGGKKSGNPGYYFHIEPQGRIVDGDFSKSVLGEDQGANDGPVGHHLLDAGVFMPFTEVLRSVRDEILDNGAEVLAALAKASAAGFELDRSNSLSRTPKGFPTPKDFCAPQGTTSAPDGFSSAQELDEYLRLKDFHTTKVVDDAYLLAPDLARRAAADFRATYEFMTLMARAARFAHENA